MIKASLFLSCLIIILLVAAIIPAQEQQRHSACVSTEDRDRIRKLTDASIEAAFQDQVMHLFLVWMRDEAGQPQRAQKGMDIAIHGYIGSRALVTAWNPLVC